MKEPRSSPLSKYPVWTYFPTDSPEDYCKGFWTTLGGYIIYFYEGHNYINYRKRISKVRDPIQWNTLYLVSKCERIGDIPDIEILLMEELI
jgi:hypothetical protein